MALSIADQKKLVEAQVTISQALNGINSTLKALNDNNILHQSTCSKEHEIQAETHKTFYKRLDELGKKYWWLILLLIIALIILAGAEKALKFFNLPVG